MREHIVVGDEELMPGSSHEYLLGEDELRLATKFEYILQI